MISVDLIDMTICDLKLGYNKNVEYIPRRILLDSFLYWYKYLTNRYSSLDSILNSLNEFGIRLDNLGWEYLLE